jgi:pimeloyl-ACP methyl ester carboxylesterase
MGNPNVKALVFVAGYAPDAGESAADLSGRFPGGTLGPTLAPPVPLPDGTNDLYIQQEKFHAQFCADVPEVQAKLMAAAQRPCADLALNEASGAPAWKTIPSWFVFGELDKNIPAALHHFMAERAEARETLEIKGASHVVGISYADTVAGIILRAARNVE